MVAQAIFHGVNTLVMELGKIHPIGSRVLALAQSPSTPAGLPPEKTL